MPKVTNMTTQTLDFPAKGGGTNKDGSGKTVSIAAGETENIDLDLDHGFVKGFIAMGAIVVSGTKPDDLEYEVATGLAPEEEAVADSPAPKRRGGRRRKA